MLATPDSQLPETGEDIAQTYPTIRDVYIQNGIDPDREIQGKWPDDVVPAEAVPGYNGPIPSQTQSPPVEAPVIVPPSNLPNHIEPPQPDDEIIDAADGEISDASPVIVDEGEVAMGGGLNVNIQGVLDVARHLDGGDGALPQEAREATGGVFDGMREAAGNIRDIGEQVLNANPAHDDIYDAEPAEVHEAEVAAPDADEDPADDPYDTDQ